MRGDITVEIVEDYSVQHAPDIRSDVRFKKKLSTLHPLGERLQCCFFGNLVVRSAHYFIKFLGHSPVSECNVINTRLQKTGKMVLQSFPNWVYILNFATGVT